MDIPLTESLDWTRKVRAENGAAVEPFNDQELADILWKQTGDARFAPAAQSSAAMRGVSSVGGAFSNAGQWVDESIASPSSPFPQRVAGRIAGQFVSSVPEMLTGAVAAYTRGVPSFLAALGGAVFTGARTKAETGSNSAALGSGAGFLASLAGGIKGGRVAERMAGPAAGNFTKLAAGAVGSAVGSAPGDALEIATSPGGFDEWLGDPVNLPAYLLGQPVGDVAFHVADKAARLRKTTVEARKAQTPDLDSQLDLSDADRFVQLNKKPVQERTELDIEEIKQISRRLGRRDEATLAAKQVKPATLDKMQEPESALRAQLYLLNLGKKAVVELPAGQEVPQPRVPANGVKFSTDYIEGYKTHEGENGNTYFYDERKTSPEQIEQAIKTNSLGILLGYGTPSVPAAPSGEVATLRGPRGNEKVAVLLGDGNNESVLKALNEMKMGEDSVNVETAQQVADWRQKNAGVQKLYSLAGDLPAPEKDISFVNHVLNMFNSSTQTKQRGTRFKGPRFQLDEQGQLGGKGLLRAVQEWAPAELWEHYKAQGIETLLSIHNVDGDLITVQTYAPGKRMLQGDEIRGGQGKGSFDPREEGLFVPELPDGQYWHRNGKFLKRASEGKIHAQEFTKWLRENTPEVEVKMDSPRSQENAEESLHGAIVHAADGYGLTVSNDAGNYTFRKDGVVVPWENIPTDVSTAMDNYRVAERRGFPDNDESADRIPFYKDIAPKDQMPGAVVVLVRVPRTIRPEKVGGLSDTRRKAAGLAPAEGTLQEPLFRGGHFGSSDVNVLASIRGYMETLPDGRKVFHIFELQSDWGQKVAKERAEHEAGPHSRYPASNYAAFKDHPLLKHYETLALKAAIQHARAEGATHIAISDAETAMMTEGHDRQNVTGNMSAKVGDWVVEKPGWDGRPHLSSFVTEASARAAAISEKGIARQLTMKDLMLSQDAGMRAAYDTRLPAIAKRLTGDSGSSVEFGQHVKAAGGEFSSRGTHGSIESAKAQVAQLKKTEPSLVHAYSQDSENSWVVQTQSKGGSPVFNDRAGRAKTQITAKLYDITNPSPEVRKLFSLYDLEEQTHFEQNRSAELDKLDSGQRDPAELTKEQMLERGVQGDRRVDSDALTNFLAAIRGRRGILREGTFLSPKVFAVMDVASRDIKFNKDLTLFKNEVFGKLAHEFTHGAILDLPGEVRDALFKQVGALGQQARQSILTDLAKQLNMGRKFDPEYLSGARFDPADPHYADRVAHEFSAGLMELAAEAHFQKHSTAEWMQWLPTPVQRLLTSVINKLKQYFSGDYPSVSHLIEPGEAARLGAVVDSLQRSVISAEQANLRALLNLKKTSTFDESRFLDQLVDSRESFKSLPQGGAGELYSLAGDLYESAASAIKKRYDNYLLPAMWRAREKPETLGHFLAIHAYRLNNVSDTHGYSAFLGQNRENSLSREQSIERWAKFADATMLDTGPKGEKFRKAMEDIQDDNQNRRQASREPLKDSDLVSEADMVSKYGLDESQTDFARRLIKVSEVVATEAQRKARQVDTINLTRLFYAANKQQDIEGVRQKVDRINRVMVDAGNKRFELESMRKQLESLRSLKEQDADLELETTQEIQVLEAQEQQFKVLLDTVFRQEFAGAIDFQVGPDPFVNRMSEFMIRMSARRTQFELMTKSAGWASMTRRGRFRLLVKNISDLGEPFTTTKEYKGFQTKKEMDDYVAKNKLTEEEIERFDMHEVADRVRAYTPSGLERAKREAIAQVDEAIAEVMGKASGLDPAKAAEVAAILSDFKSSYNPLAQEMKDVISVKGDKFAERRKIVAGHNPADFLPNTFEYMQFMTVKGNKAVAEAESNLQISRRELDGQEELRARMKREQQYVLTSQDEWNMAKKFAVYYYLGAAPRHLFQNAVQIPLNGISQMVAEGTGMGASYKHFGKAALLAGQYARKGTTGDNVLDVLLKQAEKDGISFSTALEAPLHDTTQLQNVLDSLNATAEGKITFGTKVKLESTRLWKGFEKFLQSTSLAAESANRKTTFIASILADRARGVSDAAELYKKAGQFTNYVNFIGDKPNRPGYMVELGGNYMHAPVGLLTVLQSFTINHIAQLYSFYQKGFTGASLGTKGFKGGSEADRKALLVGMAHLMAFAGSMGLIGAATAEQLLEEFADGFSLKTWFRGAMQKGTLSLLGEGHELAADRASDAVLGGFPALLGFDLSGSIGLGNPGIRYQAGAPITAEQFGGAAVGMAGRVLTGAGKVTEDPFNPQAWWDATRSASPAFLSHAIRTYDLLNRGTTLDKNQQPVTEPLGIAGSAATLAGFTPMATAKQRELNNRIYRESKKESEDYERNVLRISQLLFSAEQSGDQAMVERAQTMMADYVDSTGQTQDRDSMVGSVADQLAQLRGRVTPKASLKGSATRQRLDAAFPSSAPRYASSVDAAFLEIEVAQLLGQDDVLARALRSLPASLRDKAIADALVAAGLRPEEVGGMLQPGRQLHQGPSRVSP